MLQVSLLRYFFTLFQYITCLAHTNKKIRIYDARVATICTVLFFSAKAKARLKHNNKNNMLFRGGRKRKCNSVRLT